jgi:chitodextrinase
VSFNGTASSDSDSTPIASYRWNFGDDTTGTGASPTHVFAHSGTYRVTLTVTDTGSLTGTLTRTVTVGDRPPSARLRFLPSSPLTGKPVSFNGTTSSDPDGTISSYAWTFGDGGKASGATAKHTYTKPGTYTVQLSVTDNSGSVGVMARPLAASRPRSHAPTLSLWIVKQTLGSVVQHGLGFSASSSQAASAKLQLVLSASDAKQVGLGDGKHPVVVASLARQLAAGKTVALTLKLTSQARNLLGKVSTIPVTIVFAATGSGGKTTASRRLLLKR